MERARARPPRSPPPHTAPLVRSLRRRRGAKQPRYMVTNNSKRWITRLVCR